MTEADSVSSGGQHIYYKIDFFKDTEPCYPGGKPVLVRVKRIDDGPLLTCWHLLLL